MQTKMGCQPHLALAMTGGLSIKRFAIRDPKYEEIVSCTMRFRPPIRCVVTDNKRDKYCGG